MRRRSATGRREGINSQILVLFVGTRNPGKLRELRDLIGPGVILRPPPPGFVAPLENGTTYEENARIKARSICLVTGGPALADDSGLEVEALGGRPGIESSRYGRNDEDRIQRLLSAMRHVPRGQRAAQFRCVLVLALPNGREIVVEGSCRGEIATAPRGQGGFGYDPIFLLPDLGRTFAELTETEKGRISHRGQAVRRLVALLPSVLSSDPG